MSYGVHDCKCLFAPKNSMGGCAVFSFDNCTPDCIYYKQEKHATKTQIRLMEKNK